MIVVSPNLRVEFCARCGVGLYIVMNVADFQNRKPRPQALPVSHAWSPDGQPICFDCEEEIAIDQAEGRSDPFLVTLPDLEREYARVR